MNMLILHAGGQIAPKKHVFSVLNYLEVRHRKLGTRRRVGYDENNMFDSWLLCAGARWKNCTNSKCQYESLSGALDWIRLIGLDSTHKLIATLSCLVDDCFRGFTDTLTRLKSQLSKRELLSLYYILIVRLERFKSTFSSLSLWKQQIFSMEDHNYWTENLRNLPRSAFLIDLIFAKVFTQPIDAICPLFLLQVHLPRSWWYSLLLWWCSVQMQIRATIWNLLARQDCMHVTAMHYACLIFLLILRCHVEIKCFSMRGSAILRQDEMKGPHFRYACTRLRFAAPNN